MSVLQNQNKSSGKNKSQTSKHTSVFPNVNQDAAKQFYTVVGSRAKTSHVSRRICLSPGQVNQAVFSALFYFRWVSNTPARQIYNYQPSKYNSCILNLSFLSLSNLSYSSCNLSTASSHMTTLLEEVQQIYMSTDAAPVFQTHCSQQTCTCLNLVSKSVGQYGHKHHLSEHWTCTYGRGQQWHNALYTISVKDDSSYRAVVTHKILKTNLKIQPFIWYMLSKESLYEHFKQTKMYTKHFSIMLNINYKAINADVWKKKDLFEHSTLS